MNYLRFLKAHTLDVWCNECGCIHLDKVLADETSDITDATNDEMNSDKHPTNWLWINLTFTCDKKLIATCVMKVNLDDINVLDDQKLIG